MIDLRRVGKASQASDLGANAGTFDERADNRHTHDRRRPLCQNGTNDAAPVWHGPRLRPAFVAQVLGQVLMDARLQAAELTGLAYRTGAAQVPSALLLDDRI